METTLDKFGRIVIPERVREHLDLTPGTVLEIEAIGEDVVLKPVREEPQIPDKDGALVFTGSATGDLLEALKRHREDRSRKIGKRPNR